MMAKMRKRLGRLGDLEEDVQREAKKKASSAASEADEVAIPPHVGEARSRAQPAPMHEVLGKAQPKDAAD
jgi:hypothetical protein